MIPNGMSSVGLHRAAEGLLRERLAAFGVALEPLPDLPTGSAMLLPGGRMRVVKVLAREAPHRRGGRGDLGLHWMLTSDFEDYAALVDLSRQAVWLLSSTEFQSWAHAQRGGRWHLDWIVSRTVSSQWPDESEFERYRLERDGVGDWRMETGPASRRRSNP